MRNDIIRQTYAKFQHGTLCLNGASSLRSMGQLIDAHIHFWDPSHRRHGWLKAVPELDRRFGPEDLDFGAMTPDGFVFVEADCAPEEAIDEVRWVSSLAARGAAIVGIVAHAPLDAGARVQPLLLRLAREPLVVGVRRLLQDEPLAVLEAPALVEGARLLPAHGLTSDLCVTWEQLPAVTRLVRACPDTTFVLDHVAKPPVADRVFEPWRGDLQKLAACPNVCCKLSGLATLAPPGGHRSAVRPYLREALEAFTPERCMFGSDWPVSTQNTTYQGWLGTVSEATDQLTPLERAGVLGENAVRVYGLRMIARQEETHARS